MEDSAKHQGQRNRLVDVLISKGIESISVIKALLKVPRHLFIDKDFESHAYLDKAFPIDSNQIKKLFLFTKMVMLKKIKLRII